MAECPRILIAPGDVRYNLGDTAICLGVVELVRRVAPDASIGIWGTRPAAAGGFEGIRFTGGTNRRLLTEMARADLVIWGGGQLLQGNRSRVKIPYWALRIGLALILGRPVVGLAQGVGPLPRAFDRWLTAKLADATERFGVRDESSRALLERSGVSPGHVRLLADPALMLAPSQLPADAPKREPGEPPRLGLSLRYLGHHRADRLVPFQVLPRPWRRRVLTSGSYPKIADAMVVLADRLIEELGVNLVLVPMYPSPWETDELLTERVLTSARSPSRVRVLRATRSVSEFMSGLRTLDALVGVPMHSTILATSQGVPSFSLHYENKGLDYLEQLGAGDHSFALERLEEPRGVEELVERISRFWELRDSLRRDLVARIPALRIRAASGAELIRDALNRSTVDGPA